MSKKRQRQSNFYQEELPRSMQAIKSEEGGDLEESTFVEDSLANAAAEEIDLVSVYNCTRVNVRQAPNKEAKVAFIVPNGTVFIREKSNGAWSHVVSDEDNKRMGWIMNAFLRKVE